MEAPDQNELEKFIHAELQKLPDCAAPEGLMTNVLAAIAKREKRPWWKQSFTHWPRRVQCFLYIALVSTFCAVLYGTGRAAETVSVPDVSSQLSSWAWVGRTLRSVAEAAVLAIPGLPLEWFLAIGLLIALLYGACIAAGFALFRVTAAAGSRAA